jgi:hypothetical protein
MDHEATNRTYSGADYDWRVCINRSTKPAKQPTIHVKPQPPMGCKLIGTVKGTKIWAGECIASTPAAEIP